MPERTRPTGAVVDQLARQAARRRRGTCRARSRPSGRATRPPPSPFARARRRSRAASRRRRAFRRESAASDTAPCAAGTVRFTTMSMSSRASSASTGIASTPNFLPCAAATSGRMSAHGAHLHAGRVRQVGQVDRRDIAAADNSDADFVQECLPTRRKRFRTTGGRSARSRSGCRAPSPDTSRSAP